MKNKVKAAFLKCKSNRIILSILSVVLVLVIVMSVVFANKSGSSGVTYKETSVQYGSLIVGVTESGSVSIGTVEQTFDLDMSALKRVSTSNSSSSSNSGSNSNAGMGGMDFGGMSGGTGGSSSGQSGLSNPFSQIMSMGSSSTTSSTSETSEIVISEVCVSVGQTIEEGDVLYIIESEGVEELSQKLESNVSKAEADLEALKADQEISTLSAQYNYDVALAYSNYAATEKSSTLASLENAVTTASENLQDAQELAALYTQRLAQAKIDLQAAKTAHEGDIYCREHAESDYYYAYYALQEVTSKSTVETFESTVEQLEQKLEQANNSVTTYATQLSKAKRQLELGKITASENYELRVLANEYAQETYDIALAYLEDDLAEQQEIYDEAKEKWDEFTSYIDGVEIKANSSGVITSVNLAVGDNVTTGATVVTLYDAEDVTMTVTLDQDDMTDIELGTEANVTLNAYPDDVFKAVVTDIGDPTTDSSGNTTIDVTISFSSDVTGLYHGMTGEITFITKEVKEVLYVSNRAITRKGTKSYVKVKNGNSISTVEVVTGFSDGVNVEIKEGLSEGDVVLIESKVAE